MVNEKSLVLRLVLKNVLNFDLTKLQQKYLNIASPLEFGVACTYGARVDPEKGHKTNCKMSTS